MKTILLPPRRKPVKSGILREQPREWPRHRRFVRSHECCVPGCPGYGAIVFAHVRSAANAGTALKPHDCYGISLCGWHHEQQHAIGQPAFEKRHGIDLFALAAMFTARSPDTAMKEAMAGQG